MMDSLFQQFQQLFDDNTKWNYYHLTNLKNPFNSPECDNSKQFIKSFLEYSNKTDDIYDMLELIHPNRNLHIVTNYFLGIHFYEDNYKIKNAIDNQVKGLVPVQNIDFDNSFKYFWFLTCFYHDVGYYYEENKGIIESLQSLKKDIKIEKVIPGLIGVPKLFHNLGNKYLLYRLEKFGCYDHGIIGGMLLYDRLIKIYYRFKNGNPNNSFIHNGLYWSDSMFKYFQLIASVVLTHNIWFKNEMSDSIDDINMYKEYKLDKLIICNNSFRKINLNRHPLLFLLSLVDTIEPTKQYGIDFLKKINVIFIEKDNKILVQGQKNDDEVNGWLTSIVSLNNWLKIELNIVNDSDMEITL